MEDGTSLVLSRDLDQSGGRAWSSAAWIQLLRNVEVFLNLINSTAAPALSFPRCCLESEIQMGLPTYASM